MGKRRFGAATVYLLVCVSIIGLAPAALAACHRFTLEVSPTTVEAGDTVEVTVTRDAARADSSIRVTASGGTAQPGTDFSPLDEQINFTGPDTEESFEIDVDSDASGGTFTVGLSEPAGCEVNPNFQVASEQTVTIEAGDDPAAPVEEETTPPAVTTETGDEEPEGGLPLVLIILLVLLVLGAGFAVYSRRSRP